jgi:TRAP-type C4-dicarboxylate transport system substrate-binding protein
MKKKKKWSIYLMSVVLVAVIVFYNHNGASVHAKEIVLKGVTAWPKIHHGGAPLYWLEEMVNNDPKLQGKLKIQVLGGPEVIGTFDQLEALQKGVVQIVMGALGYWAGALPINNFNDLTPYTPEQEREKGVWSFWNRVNRKIGVYYLSHTDSSPMMMFVQKPVKRIDDLRGLKIRTSPTFVSLIKGVGAVPVRMPSSEIYTAIERGVVDGYCTSTDSISTVGLIEVTKYAIDHPFYKAGAHMFINLDTWNQLPEDVQGALTEFARKLEAKSESYYPAIGKQELEKLRLEGTKFIRFSPEEAKKFIDIAYKSHWALAFEQDPETAAQLRKLFGLPPWEGK